MTIKVSEQEAILFLNSVECLISYDNQVLTKSEEFLAENFGTLPEDEKERLRFLCKEELSELERLEKKLKNALEKPRIIKDGRSWIIEQVKGMDAGEIKTLADFIGQTMKQ